MFPTKWIKKELLFYKTMNYPIPNCDDFFYYKKKSDFDITSLKKHQKKGFSWDKQSLIMKKYIEYIDKYWWIYKSIPFVQDIYLCNSITFNAINEKSDIDIVIISKKWNIWRTRFWSVLFFWILWLKRNSSNYAKKFCLSFYIDESVLNIENIKEKWEDVYLYYWLSHCVKLYQEQENDNFFEKNNWINQYLPNFTETQQVNIWNKLFLWKNYLKVILEFLLHNKVGNLIQSIIKYIRLPIVLYKKKRLWRKGSAIIVSDKMFKFYNDKRSIYNLLFKKQSDV